MKNTNLPLLILMITIFVVARILPHPWNITPVGALAIFSGAYLGRGGAFALPLVVLLVSDVMLGFYTPVVMLFVYCGILLSALIARMALRRKRSFSRIGATITGAALCFYLLSNFGMWLAACPGNLQGFVQCYVNGLPYLARSLVGDTMYTLLLFGLYEAGQQLLEPGRNGEHRQQS